MSLELQVLEGEQQGARAALKEGAAVTIGSALDSDVVLRGAGLDGQRIAIEGGANGLRLRVLQGQAEVAGRRVAAGQVRPLALGETVGLGATRIAVVQAADAGSEAAADAPAAEAAAAPRQRSGTWGRRVAGAGAVLAAASIGMLAFAYTLAPRAPAPEQLAHRAQALLQGAGLQQLSVRAVDGVLHIDGYLESAAQRAQAEQLLAAERIGARWQVWVNEQVASAVLEVFRTHGATASAETTGPGNVRVRTSMADAGQLDRIATAARRDVPGLAALELRHEPAPAATAAPVATIDDPGKRVSSIVPGDPPYVVTADGTRYFEGALLPTGHRIAGIEEHRVVLEINGVKTPLVF